MAWYEILNVDKTATLIEIKQAYKKLVLVHHPDKKGEPAAFRAVQEAYEEIVTSMSLCDLANSGSRPGPTPWSYESPDPPSKKKYRSSRQPPKPQPKPKPPPKEKKPPNAKEDSPRNYEYYSTTKGNISNMDRVFDEIITLRRYNNRITNKVLGALIRLRGLTELKTRGMAKDELLFILFLEVPEQMLKDNIAILNIQLDGTENKQLLITKLLTSLVYYI